MEMNARNSTRLEQVRLMHEFMLTCNDENIYLAWILVMPDEPMDDDFEWFAENEKEYVELFNLFRRLIKKDGMEW